MSQDSKDIRREYGQASLARSDLLSDPFAQFTHWYQRALDAQLTDATAMTLATVGERGRPSARIVLLKDFDASGFVWFTDYRSRKGSDLAANPQAEVLFYWRELERQVRVSGTVSKVPREMSQQYFYSRPGESQWSAAASEQSANIESRAALQAKVDELQTRFADRPPAPENWGGYRLVPDEFEFWQGREGRLHDRFAYRIVEDESAQKEWRIQRLQP